MFTMRTQDEQADAGPQSVRRAVELLFAFSIDRPALSVSQLAAAASLNRTTVYRMLASLEQADLVRRHPVTSLYSLGPRILRLAEVYLHQLSDLRTVAATPLTWLRDQTGETAALHVREGLTRVVVAQVESRHEVRRTYPDMGERLSLHRGAPSQAILAFLGPDAIERYIAEAPGRWPDFDPAEAQELRDRLAEVRRAGYAISNQQRTPGVISVAAPLFDHTRTVVGAVNVSGPVQRITFEDAERFAPLVVEAATRISSDLGYEPNRAPTLSTGTQVRDK